MIVDLNELAGEPELDADVCVIGSGAAGLAVATELLGTGLRVVVLESGGWDHEAATQDLYAARTSGMAFFGHMTGRFRVFGGSTTMWGGQALPLTPLDFECRPWVAHSGWPLGYEEVAAYYPRACRFMGVDELNYDTDLFRLFGVAPPFAEQDVRYHFSKWSPTPDLRRVYAGTLRRAADVTLVQHANVTAVVLHEGLGAVKEVHVRSLQGKAGRVRARDFVLCVGGIETARVLLSNNRQQPHGIGNDCGLVGRFFMDHPAANVGVIEATRPAEVQRLCNLFHRAGRKYSVRFSATPEFQRRHQTLNVSGGVLFTVDEGSAYDALRRAYHLLRRGAVGRQFVGHLAACAAGVRDLVPVLYHYWVRRRTYTPGAVFRLGLLSEQEPDPHSRISLCAEADALGVPRADIHWHVTDLTHKTVVTFAKALAEQFSRLGIGRVRLEPWVESPGEDVDWRARLADQAHHMGTARMSRAPADGVVDTDCRVHTVHNLWVGSSAVFPTGGHSNPTLTLIALSIRIADALKRQARQA